MRASASLLSGARAGMLSEDVADLIAKAPDWEIQARWDDVGKALLDWNVAYNDTRGPHAER